MPERAPPRCVVAGGLTTAPARAWACCAVTAQAVVSGDETCDSEKVIAVHPSWYRGVNCVSPRNAGNSAAPPRAQDAGGSRRWEQRDAVNDSV